MPPYHGASPRQWAIATLALGLCVPSLHAFTRVPQTPSQTHKAPAVLPRRSLTVRHAVWSNPQATQDYMDKIGGKLPPEKTDQASVIIGKGRMGQLLYSLGKGDDLLVGRGEEIPPTLVSGGSGELLSSFPIYVAVPPHEVKNVIESIADKDKRNDLVFLHPACLETVLKRYGLCRKETTQLIPHFHINPFGRAVDHRYQWDVSKVDGEPKMVGETVVTGLWRGAVQERLRRAELYCGLQDYTQWRKAMLEQTIFESAFNLVGSIHNYKPEGLTLRDVAENHEEEVRDLLVDLGKSVTKTLAVVLTAGIDDRLVAYGKGVQYVADRKAKFPTAQDWEFTNGFFRAQSEPFRSGGFPSVCPLHDDYIGFGLESGRLQVPE